MTENLFARLEPIRIFLLINEDGTTTHRRISDETGKRYSAIYRYLDLFTDLDLIKKTGKELVLTLKGKKLREHLLPVFNHQKTEI